MRLSTKEDLYGFLDSIEESIDSQYMLDYFCDIFDDYRADFNRLPASEKEAVIDYLVNTYLYKHPDYALVLELILQNSNDNGFIRFHYAVDEMKNKIITGEVEYTFRIKEDLITFISNSVYEMINSLPSIITKKLIEFINSIEYDYSFIFENWDLIDYVTDGSRKELVNAIYKIVYAFNDKCDAHYEYNETGLYFADIIRYIRSKLNRDELESIRYTREEELLEVFGLPSYLLDDIRKDIIEEYNLSRVTDDKIAIVVIGMMLESFGYDFDFDRMYHEYTVDELYDYMSVIYAPLKFILNSDKE